MLYIKFIQSLSNPQYLNYLAQNKYLENEQFLSYLEYLDYWSQPKYAKFLVYPNCLHILTLLKQPLFRQEISRADVAKMFMDDFYMKWLNHGTAAPEDSIKKEESANWVSEAVEIKVESGPDPEVTTAIM